MKYALVAALLLLGTACDDGPPPMPDIPQALPTKPNFYMRVSFDQDPSVFMGRFVPPEATAADIDESAAMQTPCSKFITIRKVAAGGVEFDEYFTAGASAAASVGIPPVALEASASRSKVVRIKYVATEKWIAHIEDMEGFQRCCDKAPGQCTNRYIGEFLGGTGEIYAGYSQDTDLGGSHGGITAEIKDGVAWRKAVTFKNPVFFAFKTTENRIGQSGPSDGSCAHNFRNSVPKSPHGIYFVGVSDLMPSERTAREQAMLDARQQVIRYLGEQIVQGGQSVEITKGDVEALQVKMKDERFLQRASGGVARFVKDECWDNERVTVPGSTKYQARVLAFFPNEEIEAAVKAIIETK